VTEQRRKKCKAATRREGGVGKKAAIEGDPRWGTEATPVSWEVLVEEGTESSDFKKPATKKEDQTPAYAKDVTQGGNATG